MDDGSVVFEFIANRARLLFSIEDSDEESSWCLTTAAENGSVQAIGKLFPADPTNLIWPLAYLWLQHALPSQHAVS